MGFNIIVSKKAQNEIENATEYYAEINLNLALRFYNELTETYKRLELNPIYQIRHKNYRAIPLKIFPFLLFYVCDEKKKIIKVLSCFHTSKNSKKFPK
ncbi:type II toxin-antitoxin system RelE/ParE family toxin [Flavobacterium sp.]|uniref:type II toxin-antitoxin system RelE/ParE family toxin n=1 Tax=Flavobacterium sp. TaxID=239 RepID=UPI00248857F5|nr:type II toxin-antitoxin system RelE/ParE family toxin [Flavobacterium sp.]MDI1317300.1 type II toxin-antitoxin system RelE/ParE family toxin [Flavobacterium sp.]